MTSSKENAGEDPSPDDPVHQAFCSLLESHRRVVDFHLNLWRLTLLPRGHGDGFAAWEDGSVPEKPSSGSSSLQEEGLRLLDAHADRILASLTGAAERDQQLAVEDFEPALSDERLRGPRA
jgi:hypothetical protein